MRKVFSLESIQRRLISAKTFVKQECDAIRRQSNIQAELFCTGLQTPIPRLAARFDLDLERFQPNRQTAELRLWTLPEIEAILKSTWQSIWQSAQRHHQSTELEVFLQGVEVVMTELAQLFDIKHLQAPKGAS